MNVAILGLGSIGLRHARNLLSLGTDVFGYDPDPARSERLRDIGGQPVADRIELLRQCAAAVIASPNRHHLLDLDAAVAAGCHVYAEKPLAHTLEGIEKLLDQANRKQLVVFAGLNLRYHPGVAAIRERILGGAVGRVLWARFTAASYLPAWRPAQDYRLGYAGEIGSGGILFDDIHEIDLANYLLGSAEVVAAVARRTGELEIVTEDCADLILRHPGGCQSAIHMDYVTPKKQRVVEIAGHRGMLHLDISGRRLIQISNTGETTDDIAFGGDVNDDYLQAMSAFLACIDGRSSPRCSTSEAVAVLEQVVIARQLAGLS